MPTPVHKQRIGNISGHVVDLDGGAFVCRDFEKKNHVIINDRF